MNLKLFLRPNLGSNFKNVSTKFKFTRALILRERKGSRCFKTSKLKFIASVLCTKE